MWIELVHANTVANDFFFFFSMGYGTRCGVPIPNDWHTRHFLVYIYIDHSSFTISNQPRRVGNSYSQKKQ